MDKYDVQIKELKEHPDRILEHWCNSIGLFACADKNRSTSGKIYGCLTQLKCKRLHLTVEGRPDLAEQIRADPRIPNSEASITVESLPVFAEWQRKLDVELERE